MSRQLHAERDEVPRGTLFIHYISHHTCIIGGSGQSCRARPEAEPTEAIHIHDIIIDTHIAWHTGSVLKKKRGRSFPGASRGGSPFNTVTVVLCKPRGTKSRAAHFLSNHCYIIAKTTSHHVSSHYPSSTFNRRIWGWRA